MGHVKSVLLNAAQTFGEAAVDMATVSSAAEVEEILEAVEAACRSLRELTGEDAESR